MKSFTTILAFTLSVAGINNLQAASKDDPVVSTIIIDQFEQRYAKDHNPLVLEAQGWIGQDLQKLWIKADIEHVDGSNEESELQLLYSRAYTAFWDFQVGLRWDLEPTPDQHWLAVGFQGLSPYFLEVDTALFIGENGNTAFRAAVEYELMLTQQWVLSPDISISMYGKDDESRGTGKGLASIETGLRLRYEIRREIAPYIGVLWQGQYGNTATYAREEGEDITDTQFVIGIRAWY